MSQTRVTKLWPYGRLVKVPFCVRTVGKLKYRLQQTQLAGTCHRLSAPLDL